ncbi:hypothetical protein GGR54DRAFT_616662 [Hypoxylon sp. NC1633]|nr:hypothetical protein GGR54DRAFT_616662 [Hypoxylon sp. NC1633]
MKPSSTPGDPEAKRRKIRKGTRSCWECKRRKVRCSFISESAAVCIDCQRRGTSCISQEFPDEAHLSGDKPYQIADRMIRVEALVSQLVKTAHRKSDAGAEEACEEHVMATEDAVPIADIAVRHSNHNGPPRPLALYKPSLEKAGLESHEGECDFFRSPHALPSVILDSPDAGKYKAVSHALHAALPSRDDVEILWKAGAHVSVYLQAVMTTPYPELERCGLDPSRTLTDIPGPETHPVLVAKHMFQIANFLQHLDPGCHEKIKHLSEKPRVVMQRLADTAASLVTSNDELLGSVEGLECIMMEGIYQSNCGNLRRASIVFRRAMVLAQLMGIHRVNGITTLRVIDPKTKFYPRFFWTRIVYADRFHSLMLGLPQGSLDRSMVSEPAFATDTAMGQLERTHCAIASRILERNDADPTSHDYSTLREIDGDLQRAARIMPSSWWLAPNLAATDGRDEKSVFLEMVRLVNQIYHFNLLSMLHLSFILRFNSADCWHGYSQITCVNASREVLTRFVVFRSFNRVAFCCRAVDFFALMAALTLLLAHLECHRRRNCPNPAEHDLDFLAHQHLGDRAILEQVLEKMEQIARINGDALSTGSPNLLRRLLAIEANAAKGEAYSARREPVSEKPQQQPTDEENVLQIGIPYFGTIRIAREDVISKEIAPGAPANFTSETHLGSASHDSIQSPNIGVSFDDSSIEMQPSAPPKLNNGQQRQTQSQPAQELRLSGTDGPPALQVSDGMDSSFQQQHLYPGPAAVAEDWGFQGVDFAFFDNLMRGSMDQSGNWSG